ncbi:MAG: hypothetical protein JRJ87_25940 [Deltaproteobacteria bacterium]|nr:hypothetical protein [Deltaproteobacteria bacterium]
MTTTDKHNPVQIDKFVVCPNCYGPPPGVSISREQTDRYGHRLRTYMGWCLNCHLGFEVRQFQKGSNWLIHKYRYYAAVATDIYVPDWWQTVNELPNAPLVVTGPGGDYDQAYNPTGQQNNCRAIDVVQRTHKILQETTQTIGNLIDSIRNINH